MQNSSTWKVSWGWQKPQFLFPQSTLFSSLITETQKLLSPVELEPLFFLISASCGSAPVGTEAWNKATVSWVTLFLRLPPIVPCLERIITERETNSLWQETWLRNAHLEKLIIIIIFWFCCLNKVTAINQYL